MQRSKDLPAVELNVEMANTRRATGQLERWLVRWCHPSSDGDRGAKRAGLDVERAVVFDVREVVLPVGPVSG